VYGASILTQSKSKLMTGLKVFLIVWKQCVVEAAQFSDHAAEMADSSDRKSAASVDKILLE